MQSNLERFWSIVGENGCLLTEYEKIQIVKVLAEASYECPKYYSMLFEVFEDFEDSDYNFNILDYKNCTVTFENRDTFMKAFNFRLTKQECWEAMSKISTNALKILNRLHFNDPELNKLIEDSFIQAEGEQLMNKDTKVPKSNDSLANEQAETNHTEKEKSNRPKHTRQDEE